MVLIRLLFLIFPSVLDPLVILTTNGAFLGGEVLEEEFTLKEFNTTNQIYEYK